MNQPSQVTLPKLALAALAFGVPMSAFIGILTGKLHLGLGLGLVAGVLFASLMGAFARQAERTDTFAPGGAAPDFLPGERVVHQGLANHFKGIESVGGKLYLT